MEKMISYCGLRCDTCPILLATLEQDKSEQQKMRESIIEIIAKQYGMALKINDINDCDGCKANSGKLFSGCLDCEIRKCAEQNKIENCTFCSDYICEILEKHFLKDTSARERLEKIRHSN
jgi:hypothetical protein